MARKYKRDARGRFAGGGGGGSGSMVSTKVGGGGKKKASPAGQRFRKAAVKARKRTVKFVKQNPELATRLAIGAVGLTVHRALGRKLAREMHQGVPDISASRSYARSRVADVRGLGGKPGANLRAARRSVRGRHNITSMK